MTPLGFVRDPIDATGLSFGVLSTYPPTPCGIATFTSSLASALERAGAYDVGVVRISDGRGPAPDDRVVATLRNGSATSIASASLKLSQFDVAVVQHEFGLYGGVDGDEVLELLRRLQVPSIVVTHTIIRRPTANQRRVLAEVVSLASSVVVMTEGARTRLCAEYDVDVDKVVQIPHGASAAIAPEARTRAMPYILTWGLLGPGKGIERVIDAMSSLRGIVPSPRYVIAGCTHPKVLEREGESYRQMLVRRAWRNGTAPNISFDPSYRDLPSLLRLLQGAAAVVLPYDSDEQATSGVLVDAIAAGRPVIATAFPHAVELLSSGAGLVVEHDDHDGLVAALRSVFTEPDRMAAMAAEAAILAPDLSWDAVAARYSEVADELCAPAAAVAT